MTIPPGCARPIFIGGVRYRSFFEAAIDTGISLTWISLSLKKSGGFPVVIKRRLAATERWALERSRTIAGAV